MRTHVRQKKPENVKERNSVNVLPKPLLCFKGQLSSTTLVVTFAALEVVFVVVVVGVVTVAV